MSEAPEQAGGTAVALQAMASEQSMKTCENCTSAKITNYHHDMYGRKVVVCF
jgi:hypothetical protein